MNDYKSFPFVLSHVEGLRREFYNCLLRMNNQTTFVLRK